MEFGYFTLSDNHYENNHARREPVRSRTSLRKRSMPTARHAFGLDRRAPFQLARRTVLPRPGAVLYRRAHQAHQACAGRHGRCRCTTRSASPSSGRRSICFRTAASISPLGRGYDSREYDAISCRLRRQPGHLRRRPGGGAQAVGGRRAASRTTASIIRFDNVRITPKPVQRPLPVYVGSFSKPSIELAAQARLRPDRRAVRRRDELRRAEAGGRPLPRDLRPAWHEAAGG